MKLFAAIKLILTLHCEESTMLMSESLDRELSFSERWAVRLHHLCCKSCRRFLKQLKFIRAAARAAGKPAVFGQFQLSEESRQRIIAKFREQNDAS